MQVSEALLKRKSVRAFLNKPIERNLIIEILSYASKAPSGSNTQPWEVAIVSGKIKDALDNKLREAFWQQIPKNFDYQYYPKELPPQFRQRKVECGSLMYNTLKIKKEDIESRKEQWALNYSAFNAPVVLYFFADKRTEKGSFIDYGMFLQSIMLMATSYGISTCPQAALAEYPQIIKDTLGYNNDFILICGMAMGYEDKNAIINSYKTSRRNIEEFAKFFM